MPGMDYMDLAVFFPKMLLNWTTRSLTFLFILVNGFWLVDDNI